MYSMLNARLSNRGKSSPTSVKRSVGLELHHHRRRRRLQAGAAGAAAPADRSLRSTIKWINTSMSIDIANDHPIDGCEDEEAIATLSRICPFSHHYYWETLERGREKERQNNCSECFDRSHEWRTEAKKGSRLFEWLSMVSLPLSLCSSFRRVCVCVCVRLVFDWINDDQWLRGRDRRKRRRRHANGQMENSSHASMTVTYDLL